MSVIHSLGELQSFAEAFLKAHPQGGVFGLSGDLGAGKTAFVKKLVALIDSHTAVTSPSFVIHVSYAKLPRPVEHFDFYRMEKLGEKELSELGYFDAVMSARERQGFVFVEWPERAPQELLELDACLTFTLNPDASRTII